MWVVAEVEMWGGMGHMSSAGPSARRTYDASIGGEDDISRGHEKALSLDIRASIAPVNITLPNSTLTPTHSHLVLRYWPRSSTQPTRLSRSGGNNRPLSRLRHTRSPCVLHHGMPPSLYQVHSQSSQWIHPAIFFRVYEPPGAWGR